MRHGVGEMRYAADFSVYNGGWVRDVREGKGVLTFADGAQYAGKINNRILRARVHSSRVISCCQTFILCDLTSEARYVMVSQ